MNLFHIIEGETIILRSRGVFRQVDVFARGGELYAKSGNGFVRVLLGGKTSSPTTFWEDLSVRYIVGDLGRLLVQSER